VWFFVGWSSGERHFETKKTAVPRKKKKRKKQMMTRSSPRDKKRPFEKKKAVEKKVKSAFKRRLRACLFSLSSFRNSFDKLSILPAKQFARGAALEFE
jgi:hypothetical protein